MKQRSILKECTLAGIACLFILTSCSQKQNWPQFRGPHGNMLSSSKSLPEVWDTVKNVAWTYKNDGTGWSSPIVWGNKVFITSTFPEKVAPVPEHGPMQGSQGPRPGQGQPNDDNPEDNDTTFKQDIYRWEVTCVDLNTGKELWKKVAFKGNPKVKKQPMNTYASETPATDGKRVFAYFGMTGLFCYEMDGNLLWKKDLGAYNTQGGWGTGSSPIISNGILYIQVDNEVSSFLVALDAATGEEKWKAQREEKTNYSTPYIWKNKIRTELISCGKTARSYNPETGILLWELKTGGEQAIPSPVGDENNLYLGNAGGQETKGNLYAVKAGAEGDITPKTGDAAGTGVLWIFPDPGLGSSSPLLYNGLLYIISSRGGEIKCIKADDGALVSMNRVPGLGAVWASPWVYNNKIWFFDEKGITKSFVAGNAFKIISDNRLDGKFWASVAITGNAYIFKSADALYCIKE
ncbi:MAG: PQQ-binding-like beta-propeller repeat protein [Bacteroidia bacterium]|nr:PQQ-binding-like beta-propeller repeat protein [Bacteroidia bacterium]